MKKLRETSPATVFPLCDSCGGELTGRYTNAGYHRWHHVDTPPWSHTPRRNQSVIPQGAWWKPVLQEYTGDV